MKKVNSVRCHKCNKKLGLLGIQCSCKSFFCSSCRYAEQHNCPFDYKTLGKEQIRLENPLIVSVKLEKM